MSIPKALFIEINGDKVHRPVGPWTMQVHKFLLYLHKNGFKKAPIPFGFDEYGREIICFLAGQTRDYPLSDITSSIKALISAAKLLRQYHDVSKKYLNEIDVTFTDWMLPIRTPAEVICHNDFAPYNILFNEQAQAVGLIDFDTIHPGSRVWDIAYALYRFAPFTNHDNKDGFGNIDDQIQRAKIFCDVYGLNAESKVGIASLIISRLKDLINFMEESASLGNEKYRDNIRNGHHLKYLEDIKYIGINKSNIENGLR